MALNPQLTDLLDAGSTVGSKNQGEQLGNEVIEIVTCIRVLELRAVGAGKVFMRYIAGTNLAPAGFLILMTSRALIPQEPFACPAIQSAKSHLG
jgi:hypothetical protein